MEKPDLSEVDKFDKDKLKATTTEEKPDKAEKPDMTEVKEFKRSSLKKATTEIKNTLPTQSVIEQERKLSQTEAD
ncbi:unnamed protein product [Lampetra planeri]